MHYPPLSCHHVCQAFSNTSSVSVQALSHGSHSYIWRWGHNCVEQVWFVLFTFYRGLDFHILCVNEMVRLCKFITNFYFPESVCGMLENFLSWSCWHKNKWAVILTSFLSFQSIVKHSSGPYFTTHTVIHSWFLQGLLDYTN